MRLRSYSYWWVIIAILYGLIELWSAIGYKLVHEIWDVDYSPFPVALIQSQHEARLLKLINDQTKYNTYSRELGWTIKPNGRSPKESANSQGIRADRTYSLAKPAGVTRIAAFGDSFTHGSKVKNPDTWAEVLARQDTGIEVINFGVGGFGLDQALLRYRKDGRQFQPDIVLIGYMSDDISRHINTFRPFTQHMTGMPLTKPRFVLDNGQLTLIPNPVQSVEQYRGLLQDPQVTLRRFGEHDVRYQHAYTPGPVDFLPSVRFFKTLVQFYRYPGDALIRGREYNVKSEAYRVTERLFDAFHDEAVHDGALPVIVIFPNNSDIDNFWQHGHREYAPLLRHFEKRGYTYIDGLHAFEGDARKLGLDAIIRGHYTPLGNRLFGEHVYQFLMKNGLPDNNPPAALSSSS